MPNMRRIAIISAVALGAATSPMALSHGAFAADLKGAEGTVIDEGRDDGFLPKNWNIYESGGHSLEFHGYYRYGYGWTPDGEPMPSFQAPGALSKYRLGNEDVQGGEIVIDYRYYLDGIPENSRKNETGSRFIQIQGRWEEFRNIREIDELFLEFTNDFTKEAFIRLGNFIADGTHVWFGRRFYDRQDIHAIDHFWLNVAQGSDYGGGIEGIKLWDNKTIDVAAFYAYDEGAQLSDVVISDDNINSFMLDFRVRGYSFGPDSSLTLVGQIGYRPGYDVEFPDGVSVFDTDDKIGFALGGYHELKNVYGGRNKTGLMFRQGAAMVQGDFNSRAPTELQGYDLDDAWSLEVNNDLLVELAPRWSMQWVSVARHEDTGLSGEVTWLSTGVRPMFYITPQINIAWESGIDYVDNGILDASGFLWKNTLALQFQQQPGYFERPVLRLFGTYATWSEELSGIELGANGIAAGSEFSDDTDGFIFGVQIETWW